MNRLGYLATHPKRTLGALGTLLAAAGLTVGSGAYFQDTASSNANSASAGKLDVNVYGSTTPAFDGSSTAIASQLGTVADGGTTQGAAFSITKLVPTAEDGSAGITRAFRVKNDGDVPASLRLDVVNTIPSAADTLDKTARLTITRTGGGTVLSSQTFSAADAATTDVPLDVVDANGTRTPLPVGQSYTYEVKVWLPESGSDQSELMSDAFSTELKVIARSVGGTGA